MFLERISIAVNPLRRKIVNHPYNTQLFNGSLPPAIFKLYIEQDFIYLYQYARILKVVAWRFEQENSDKFYPQAFREFSTATLRARNDLHATYLARPERMGFFNSNKPPIKLIDSMSIYIRHLQIAAQNKPLPVVVASLAPCFWSYAEIGKDLGRDIDLTHNRYRDWITLQYCSNEFDGFTARYLNMLDKLAQMTPESIQIEMINAFSESLQHEHDIWDEVYFSPQAFLKNQSSVRDAMKRC